MSVRIIPLDDGNTFQARGLMKKLFKEKVKVILVGGIRSYSVAENIVKKKIADYVSMSRPFIREPGLIIRWKSGDHKKSFCNSDNLCLRSALSGDGVFCVTVKQEGAVL